MDISNEITTDTTIDTPPFVEDVETSNEPTDSTLNKSNPTTAAKNKNERRNEKISINLHSTNKKRRYNQENNRTWCINRIQKR